MSLKIDFKYNIQNIERTIENLSALPDEIDTAIHNGLNEVSSLTMDKIEGYAGNYKPFLDVNFIDENVVEIEDLNWEAQFVEYGTGIEGLNNPHPEPADDWVYDSHSHGESGWIYFNQKLGRMAWTKGLVGRRFMYRARLWARSQATKIINKHLRNIR